MAGFNNLSDAYRSQKDIKILAIADLQREETFLPDVPTLKEEGVDVDNSSVNFRGIMAPKGTDPKIIELTCYADIPHLLTPVMTNMNEAASALWWCVNEMERRYTLLAKFSVRYIEAFNEKLLRAKKSGKPLLDSNTAKEGEQHPELEALPLIVIVIDEYADMLGALAQQDRAKSKRVEGLIVRIAQKARAAGVHLIMATQRPSVDVITGTIKANFPTRISFQVSSKIDSRTILGEQGAEQLLGKGDMLFMSSANRIVRIHGPYVSESETEKVNSYLRSQGKPNYIDEITIIKDDKINGRKNIDDEKDELYSKAVDIIKTEGKASTSFLQRKLQIGYNRAARIMETMEKEGIVGQANHVGKREIL